MVYCDTTEEAVAAMNRGEMEIILAGNFIGDTGLGALAKALAASFLGWNSIGADMAGKLAKALETNSTLTKLSACLRSRTALCFSAVADQLARPSPSSNDNNNSLRINNIGDAGAGKLAKALETNSTLTSLDLGDNSIGADGAGKLAKALETNSTLTSLNLGGLLTPFFNLSPRDGILGDNSIGADGAGKLAKALETNSTLTSLDLAANSIGADGAGKLAKALETNSTLTSLNIAWNGIGDAGAGKLAKALETNSTLTSLNVWNNEIGAAINSQIISRLGSNKSTQRREAADENSALEQHFRAAIAAGDLQEWARAKLMVVGQGAAGKTQTVRSLLGLSFQAEHNSTEVAAVTQAQARNWKPQDAGESNFDLLAGRAAAARAANKGEPAKPKRESLAHLVRARVTSLAKRLSSPRPCPPPPQQQQQQRDQERRPRRELLDEAEIARRFDFEEVKRLATKTEEGTDVSFSIWDFAGQEVFYALHHIFLSEKGLYIVVFSMSDLLRPAEEDEVVRYLRFWLNSIELHAPSAPIILVGTRADEVSAPAERERVNACLRSELGTENRHALVRNAASNLYYFPVDNASASASRAAALRTVVQETATAQAYIRRQVPLTWLKVLDEMIVSKEPYFTFDKVAELGAEYGMSSEDTDKMLGELDELGVVVHQRATAALQEVVVVEPQWLLDKLAAVIADELHVKNKFFDKRYAEVKKPLVELRRSGVATRALLEVLWGSEQVEYLIDFMTESWLLSEHEPGTYMVASLVTQEDRDALVDIAHLEGGLQCELEFPWLPNGVFQRLVAQCATHAKTVTDEDLWTCDVGKTKALLVFGSTTFSVQVLGDSLVIKVDPDAADAALMVKKLVSMIRQQKAVLFRSLDFKLLAVDEGGVAVEFSKLKEARTAGKRQLKGYRPRKVVQVANFAAFFDERHGGIDSDAEGTDAKNRTQLAPLAPGLKHHVFLSHVQSTGGDLAEALKLKLEYRGLSVWFDKAHRDELNEAAMLEGVKRSKCYLLLLTKGVFESAYVVAELKQAIAAGKRVLMVHESESHRASYAPFKHYIDTAPSEFDLFKNVQSLEVRRYAHEVSAFLDELVRRIGETWHPS